MTRIAVVDHGAGNLVSIVQALEHVGAEVTVAHTPAELDPSDGIVVPGVGASGPAMRRLRRTGLAEAIPAAIERGAVYLGICLGLQLLFQRSDEDGSRGLGLLAGHVAGLPNAPRLPHIGWNTVEPLREHPLLGRLPDPFACYFVHSFAPVPDDTGAVVAETEHGGRFASVVASGRLLGVQFHPERSGEHGLRLLANYLALVADPGDLSVDRTEPGLAPVAA